MRTMQQAVALPARYHRFIKVALELAAASDNGMTYQLCSLVVRKNRVLSVGYNSRKTHTIMSDTRMNMLHAECDALLACRQTAVDGAEVIVARVRPSGKAGLARPCAVCEKILRRFGVRRVVYTTYSDDPDNPRIEEMKL